MAKRHERQEHRDRRLKRRFDIEQTLHYRVLYGTQDIQAGTGRTVNISSGGVRFTTEGKLRLGLPVELSISWPVRLDGDRSMNLIICGSVVRSDGESCAVVLEKYQFRSSALEA